MDSEKIVSGSYDRALKVWNIENGQCNGTLKYVYIPLSYRHCLLSFHSFSGHNEAVLCLQYDGDKVVSGSADNAIKVRKNVGINS